ncbi:MAG: HEAT repeat domain-containing protein [Planctomycetes bacterium]|nr:HEAT repeat domain-containing protein [Planctomycetota bacterium]
MHRRKAWRWAIATLVLSQCLLAFYLFSNTDRERVLVEQWKRDTDSLTVSKMIDRLKVVARSGGTAVLLLVYAMTDSREPIVDAASLELRGLMDRWQTLDDEAASRNVANLAHHLAMRGKLLSPSGRRAAANLATQILLWPLNSRKVDGAQVVLDCESVLRAYVAIPRREATVRPDRVNRIRVEASIQHPGVRKENARLLEALSQIPPLPPVEYAPPVSSQKVIVDPPPSQETANRSRLITPRILDLDADPSSSEPKSFQPLQTAPIRQLPVELNQRAQTPEQLANLSLIDVMRQLHAEDPKLADAAEAALEQQGLSATERMIALRLTDPDPIVRRELARRLPRIGGVEPTEWLMWLTRDSNALVRAEAISILGTSRDPQIRDTVRRILEREGDPRILQRVIPRP